jgi:alkanesulfonate monooxygenase SsuD/methylene tetrahydromethanopterin reductase-like flavin-dependent oxidoreductase (luciferase family)
MSLDEDLEDLDQSIRRLQIEWDKFFAGLERTPPHELKRRTEVLIRRNLGTEIRNGAQRFRFQSLSARYNTYNELWSKRLRYLEEGRPWHGARVTPASPEAPQTPARERQAAARAGAAGDGGYRVSNSLGDGETVKRLYDQFVEARQQSGETAAVKFESFHKLIAQQTGRILSEKGAKAVDFRLETQGGKVSLKAKPVK